MEPVPFQHIYALSQGFAAKIPPDHFASLNANLGADSPIDYIGPYLSCLDTHPF